MHNAVSAQLKTRPFMVWIWMCIYIACVVSYDKALEAYQEAVNLDPENDQLRVCESWFCYNLEVNLSLDRKNWKR